MKVRLTIDIEVREDQLSNPEYLTSTDITECLEDEHYGIAEYQSAKVVSIENLDTGEVLS